MDLLVCVWGGGTKGMKVFGEALLLPASSSFSSQYALEDGLCLARRP